MTTHTRAKKNLFLKRLLLRRRSLILTERANQIEQIILLLLLSISLSLSSSLLLLNCCSILGINRLSRRVDIVAAAETGTESRQTTGLVVFDVHQLAAGWVPQER